MTEADAQSGTDRTQFRLRMSLNDPEAIQRIAAFSTEKTTLESVKAYSEASFELADADLEYAYKKRLLDIYRAQVNKYNTTLFPTRGPIDALTKVVIKPKKPTVRQALIGLPVDFGPEAGKWLMREPFFNLSAQNQLPVFRLLVRNLKYGIGTDEEELNEYLKTIHPAVKLGALAIVGQRITNPPSSEVLPPPVDIGAYRFERESGLGLSNAS
jgi:hypothetical protein